MSVMEKPDARYPRERERELRETQFVPCPPTMCTAQNDKKKQPLRHQQVLQNKQQKLQQPSEHTRGESARLHVKTYKKYPYP